MKYIFTPILIAAALTACTDSDYQTGTNYILKNKESIYINHQDNKYLLINRDSGESVTGTDIVNDASPANEIIKGGYIQIKFEKPAFGIPSTITLQQRDPLPYLCNQCPEGMREWNRKKS